MIRPAAVKPGEQVFSLGKVFGTPVVVKGVSWLPVLELGLWGVMTRLAGRRNPDRPVRQRVWIGLAYTILAAGSEWCHNFAHAAAAWWVGKPMDALRIFWGTPLVVYHDIEDPAVSPKEHIIRALGGPIFNALALLGLWIGRAFTRPCSLARDFYDLAMGSNLFLLLVGLLPLPGIDGGPILKWSLVSRGRHPLEADRVVRKVDGVLAVGLVAGAWAAFKRNKRPLGFLFTLLGGTALALAFGWIQEQETGKANSDLEAGMS